MEQPVGAGGGGDGHEPAAAGVGAGEHGGDARCGGVPDAPDVDVPQQVEVVAWGLPQRLAAGDHGGRSDGDVQAAPRAVASATAARRASRSRTSATTWDARRAARRARPDRRGWPAGTDVGLWPGAPVDGDHPVAVGDQPRTVAAPMPPSGAGDQRDPGHRGLTTSCRRRRRPSRRAGRRLPSALAPGGVAEHAVAPRPPATPPAISCGQELAQRRGVAGLGEVRVAPSRGAGAASARSRCGRRGGRHPRSRTAPRRRRGPRRRAGRLRR